MACVVMDPALAALGRPAPFFMLGYAWRTRHAGLSGSSMGTNERPAPASKDLLCPCESIRPGRGSGVFSLRGRRIDLVDA
jgi:hypothetical protein